jgi:esterase/lipase/1-acyl-sn-glycerol-3-phosphate acyltransferase
MSAKTFRYAALALKILEKILGSKFSVSGLENLPNQPVMFVANHFTRAETFFIPYIIYKNTGRQVRCLADASLYHGRLGRFLESVGTISTKNSNRDKIILKDLVTGEYDWMIYPEGSMLKSKEVTNKSGFVNYTPYRVGPVRTGSAVLALKSQLYRSDMIDAFNKNQPEILHDLEENLEISYNDYFRHINTHIVPLSITYYPLRPGHNRIQSLASRLIKKIPQQVSEELEIEGNLLLGADININFGKAINLAEHINSTRNTIYQLPIIKNETKTNLILRYFKTRLTNDFMSKIYSDIQINLDHIFSACLKNFPENEIEVSHLKRLIYLSASMIHKCGKYRLNPSIFEENLLKLFCDETHEGFESVFDLAKKQGLIEIVATDKIHINKQLFDKKVDFHQIRLENSLQVVQNEFSLLEFAEEIIKKNCKIPDDLLRKKTFTEICKRDLEIFNSDYEIYFDEKLSKNKLVGAPFFLDCNAKTCSRTKKIGMLVIHGYKSAPLEAEPLARFINGFGFKTYVPRLKGHGTAPINMQDISWQDWYDSVNRGYAALSQICSKIVIIGFSTGGLLGLLSAAKKTSETKKLTAIIAINSALKLLDIKARVVPGITFWNDMLTKLNIEKGRFEYVDDVPENPHINYSRNYLKGVQQLEKLMKVCENNLEKVTTNALIIQGDKDPVVNPVSGKMIYNKIHPTEKKLSEVSFSNHVIINGSRKEEVFELIKNFLCKLKLL